MISAILIGLVALAVHPPSAAAQADFYGKGNRLYQEGDFAGALEAYESILDAGFESGDLHFNTGNAYFKLGDLGRAILHYERARRLQPRDEGILANLELARTLTVDEVEALPRFWVLSAWDWWIGLLPRSLLLLVVTFSYLAGMAGLVALIMRRGTTVALWGARLAWIGGVLTLVFGLNLAVRELGLGRAEEAVVLVAEIPVRSAPSDDGDLTVFTVHEGTKVRIDRRSDEWAEVVLEDGKVGWVKLEAVETI
ncbi:MAG: tetratricopeptide repeat protein [Gemmatimonadota bacterium]|nr:MAG: tetratricopeptide repeat protein [Gemmatimonadota bacterium]